MGGDGERVYGLRGARGESVIDLIRGACSKHDELVTEYIRGRLHVRHLGGGIGIGRIDQKAERCGRRHQLA